MRLKWVLVILFTQLILFQISAQRSAVEKEVLAMFDEGQKDLWLHSYQGTLDDLHAIKLTIAFDGKVYKGVYQYRSSGTYFNLEGAVNEKGILELQEMDSEGYTTGYLLLRKEGSSWIGEWRNIDQKMVYPVHLVHEGMAKREALLQKEKTFEKYEYADFDVRLEWTFPNLKNQPFNQWMDKKTIEWKRALREEIQEMKKSDPGLTAKDRFRYEAYAWTEINCQNERLISGKFHFQKSWSNRLETGVFHFDLKEGESFSLENVFKVDMALHNEVKKAIDEELKVAASQGEMIKSWLKKESFKHFTLGHDGLVISTDFNTIFGSRSLVVPYAELKDVIKKSAISKSLINF